jgi:hypothetical protein
MKVRQRTLVLGTTVILLVVANLWRFWPSVSSGWELNKRGAGPGGEFQAEDFVVHALPSPEDSAPQRRDLFRIATVARPVRKAATARLPPPPPPKTPEQLAVESAQAELSEIRCVGTAFHKQRSEAFLIVNGQNAIVSLGQKAGGRFVVEEITRASVLLRDPATQTAGRIIISGQPQKQTSGGLRQ